MNTQPSEKEEMDVQAWQNPEGLFFVADLNNEEAYLSCKRPVEIED